MATPGGGLASGNGSRSAARHDAALQRVHHELSPVPGCSFTIARLTWVRTVSGLSTSSSAISSLDRPVATQADDLALPLGEVGRAAAAAGRRRAGAGEVSITRRVTDGSEQRAAVGDDPDRLEQARQARRP